MTYARKVDASHNAIRTAFQKCGAVVCDTFRLGAGVPDMVVGFKWGSFWVECKSGNAKTNADVKEAQEAFVAKWPNDVYVVRDPADVPAAILSMSREMAR